MKFMKWLAAKVGPPNQYLITLQDPVFEWSVHGFLRHRNARCLNDALIEMLILAKKSGFNASDPVGLSTKLSARDFLAMCEILAQSDQAYLLHDIHYGSDTYLTVWMTDDTAADSKLTALHWVASSFAPADTLQHTMKDGLKEYADKQLQARTANAKKAAT